MSQTQLNGLNNDLGRGGTGLFRGGDPNDLFAYLQILGARGAPAQANAAAISAMAAKDVADGMQVLDKATGNLWRAVASGSPPADSTGNAILAGPTGFYFQRADKRFDVKLPIAFGTVDAAALWTVPTGLKLNVLRAYWEVGTSFTGGASSAIGVSSTDAAYNTKGDILGGAAGDVAATLVSTGSPYKGGTLGAKFGSNGVIVLVGGDVVRFDRITSAFTAGAGFVHLDVEQIG